MAPLDCILCTWEGRPGTNEQQACLKCSLQTDCVSGADAQCPRPSITRGRVVILPWGQATALRAMCTAASKDPPSRTNRSEAAQTGSSLVPRCVPMINCQLRAAVRCVVVFVVPECVAVLKSPIMPGQVPGATGIPSHGSSAVPDADFCSAGIDSAGCCLSNAINWLSGKRNR